MNDPYFIDPERLTAQPQLLKGTFLPADLERLQDMLANDEGELRYRITALREPHGRKVASCIIEGFVFLTCQVSLEAFRHEIAIEDRLILVDDESQLPPVEAESETEDYLVADEPLDIRDLVEDAVLLSLPMMPRKPDLGETGRGAGGVPETEKAPPGESKPSPFAALASLKKPR